MKTTGHNSSITKIMQLDWGLYKGVYLQCMGSIWGCLFEVGVYMRVFIWSRGLYEGVYLKSGSIWGCLFPVYTGECPDVVIIHDAVRPFVDEETMRHVANAANEHGVSTVGMSLMDDKSINRHFHFVN